MFKINDKSTRTRQDICSKVFWKVVVYLASFWCLVFTVSFEHITHLALFIAFFFVGFEHSFTFSPFLIPRGNVGTTKANNREIFEPKVSSRINYWCQ